MRQRRMRRHLHRRAVLGVDHPAADQTADLVGGELGAGQHGKHARHPVGGSVIDLADFGARMGRPQEAGMGLPRAVDVGGVLALAGDEALILFAAYRRTDAGRAHGSLLPGMTPLRSTYAFAACPIALAPAAIALTMLW